MAETNGHAPALEAPDAQRTTATASAGELDALLQGLFEPVTYELAPGRSVEIRPLPLKGADALYGGGAMSGSALQRFMLARCVFINDRPLGDELAATLPIALANRLVPVVMNVNGMEFTPAAEGAAEGEGKELDPKA